MWPVPSVTRQDLVVTVDADLVPALPVMPSLPSQGPRPRGHGHKRCRKCGKVVSLRAFVCRRCGKRQRISRTTILLSLAALALGAMFAVAVAGTLTPRSPDGVRAARAASAAAAAAAAAGRNPAHLRAADLWADYHRDAAAADRAYKDKPVKLTGVVMAAPTRDYRGNIVLRLGTGDVFEMVRATLASRDGTQVLGIGKGQTVTVGCTGRGALIGAPELDGCVIIP
jgi:tRNA_anti-like